MSNFIKLKDRYNDVEIINVQYITRIHQESMGTVKLPYVTVELASGNCISLTSAEAQKIYNIIGMSL